MMANQLRMWFSAMAYVLVDTLRRVGLHFTQFADASAQTIRLQAPEARRPGALLACGAFTSPWPRGCPNKIEFELAAASISSARSALRRCGPRQTTRTPTP